LRCTKRTESEDDANLVESDKPPASAVVKEVKLIGESGDLQGQHKATLIDGF